MTPLLPLRAHQELLAVLTQRAGRRLAIDIFLVAAGAKPATFMHGTFPSPDYEAMLATYEHAAVIRELRLAGWTVAFAPVRGIQGEPAWTLVLARDGEVAKRIVESARVLDALVMHPRYATEEEARMADALAATEDDHLDWDVLRPVMTHPAHFELGAALGYPRSGTEAFLGLRPRLHPDDLPVGAGRLVACAYAADGSGPEEAQEHLLRQVAALRSQYPEALFHPRMRMAAA